MLWRKTGQFLTEFFILLFVISFAVGSDGAAYEGRGWDVLGAHALHFNNASIGICLIGDWGSKF